LVYEDDRTSFTDAYLKAANLAWRLREDFGIEKGDRVAIASRNYPEWCLAFMAITSLGCIAVALNAWWSGEELVYGLEDSGSKLVLADNERLERLRPFLPDLDLSVIAIRPTAAGAAPSSGMPSNGAAEPDIAPLLEGDRTTMPAAELHPDDDAMLMYTSGTTGKPKGVVTSHRAIITPLIAWAYIALITAFTQVPKEELEPWKRWLFKETDELPVLEVDADTEQPPPQPAMILTFPMFHVSGVIVQFLNSIFSKRKLVLMYKWNPEKALELIERERITAFDGVPTLSWELLNSPDFEKRDTSSLLALGAGGAKRPVEQANQIQKRFKSEGGYAGYGLTETSALGTSIRGEDYANRPASAGRPLEPLLEMQIQDEKGNTLPPNREGEICIKSCSLFRGYWNNPEATAQVFRNGWFRTGDLGHLDDEGFLFITGRAKDIVIRGGENIGCPEVEEVLYEHPAVFEAAVFGLPDERLGERLAATVRVRPGFTVGEDELKSHVGGRLAKYKVPSVIWLSHEQLPRNATGKLDKRRLRRETLGHNKA
ncbi:MAG: acyl--CoA ligase, partial [Desulfobacterales bacterium]|nr:acyl--CoA ligase [Desulfobacterales bacterium]